MSKKIKVMVVDDEPKIRMFIRANLEARGYEVHLAEDGAKAVEMAAELIPEPAGYSVECAGNCKSGRSQQLAQNKCHE